MSDVRASEVVCKGRAASLSLMLFVLATFAGACARVDSAAPQAAPAVVAPRRLASAAPSTEALAKRFLQAIEAENIDDLRSLRVTKDEYCRLLWAELPGSRVPNLSCDFAWDQATLRSEGGLYKLWPRHKGRHYELISLSFAGGAQDYGSFKALKDPRLVIKDKGGTQQEVRLFGSVLELDGQYKLFSFIFD